MNLLLDVSIRLTRINNQLFNCLKKTKKRFLTDPLLCISAYTKTVKVYVFVGRKNILKM